MGIQPKPIMLIHSIEQESPDEHVFIVIRCPGRPSISLDLMNHAGRRGLGIRIDGMGVADVLVDVKELSPKGESGTRFCGMCGEALQLHSSRSHKCAE